MAWRGIHLSSPAKLSVANHQLIIARNTGETFQLPLEDIAYIILDTQEATLTAPLLDHLAQAGITILGIDAKHTPSWSILPCVGHHKIGETLHLQLHTSTPTSKRIWQSIIHQKITNQANVLSPLNPTPATALRALLPHIQSGDSTNIEARAARIYWAALLGENFIRQTETYPNALLNYGYAIIRSALARHLVAAGFMPQIGLHHHSLTNPFNLADDLIEPYRPFIDRLAHSIYTHNPNQQTLTLTNRQTLASILHTEIRFHGETLTLLTCTERTVNTLRNAMKNKLPNLLQLPIID